MGKCGLTACSSPTRLVNVHLVNLWLTRHPGLRRDDEKRIKQMFLTVLPV